MQADPYQSMPDRSNEDIVENPPTPGDGVLHSLADYEGRPRTADELVGVNDGEPRIADPSTVEAVHVRRRQWNAWHYPPHLRKRVRPSQMPAECPQCFGITGRCPMVGNTRGDGENPDWRLCPHAV